MDKHNLFTSNFKENTKFVFKLFALLGIIILFFIHISPQYNERYTASLIDKVDRLNEIDEPKIVLISNSNLVFGIDSRTIEEAIGMPVVNMGLHGGLGNVFHERMIQYNISEGDIYILCHCDYSDNGQIGNKELAWITLENHYELWKILRPEDYLPMLKAYPVYLKKALGFWAAEMGNREPDDIYRRSAFNEYGDIVLDDNDKLEYTFVEGDIIVPGVSNDVCNRLNKLNKYVSERGATLLIAGYPIAKNEFTPDIKLFDEFQKQLEQKVDIPVISNYRDYIYDEKYFFNASLHLNNDGKRLRTEQLINDLNRYLSSQGNYDN